MKTNVQDRYRAACLRFTVFNSRAQRWQQIAYERKFSDRRIMQIIRVERKLLKKAQVLMHKANDIPISLVDVHIPSVKTRINRPEQYALTAA